MVNLLSWKSEVWKLFIFGSRELSQATVISQLWISHHLSKVAWLFVRLFTTSDLVWLTMTISQQKMFYFNNSLAFNIAENILGIPSLLDPQVRQKFKLLKRMFLPGYGWSHSARQIQHYHICLTILSQI